MAASTLGARLWGSGFAREVLLFPARALTPTAGDGEDWQGGTAYVDHSAPTWHQHARSTLPILHVSKTTFMGARAEGRVERTTGSDAEG
jgi:hypothetical protein